MLLSLAVVGLVVVPLRLLQGSCAGGLVGSERKGQQDRERSDDVSACPVPDLAGTLQ